MTTTISNATRSSVSLSVSAARVTQAPAEPFRAALRGTAVAAIAGAQAAAQRMPGGALLAAAVTGPSGAAALPSSAGGSVSAALESSGAVVGGASDMQQAMREQANNALYYLELQQQVQDENRSYTTMSNVLKARHDTVKGAIGNIR